MTICDVKRSKCSRTIASLSIDLIITDYNGNKLDNKSAIVQNCLLKNTEVLSIFFFYFHFFFFVRQNVVCLIAESA